MFVAVIWTGIACRNPELCLAAIVSHALLCWHGGTLQQLRIFALVLWKKLMHVGQT